MNLLMLCREPRLYSCQRLRAAAQKRGHKMDILDPNRCLLKLNPTSPHFDIYYQQDTHKPPILLSHYDGVLPRFGVTSTQMGCFVLQHFQAQGIPCLNTEAAVRLARDKWQSLQVLHSHHIPIPLSTFAGTEVTQPYYQMAAPMVLKHLQGMQGDGVMLANTWMQAEACYAEQHTPMLAQEFIAQAKGKDLRCFVIGDRVVATMQRQSPENDFRANCHLGGKATVIDVPESVKQLAVQATKTIGLDVAGVDLIQSERGYLVLEVNASPGLEMIEKTSGIDIADRILAYFESKITKFKKSSDF